jgi:uncharacterized Zn finger protein
MPTSNPNLLGDSVDTVCPLCMRGTKIPIEGFKKAEGSLSVVCNNCGKIFYSRIIILNCNSDKKLNIYCSEVVQLVSKLEKGSNL